MIHSGGVLIVKIPSGSLKVIYGAGETAQLSEARLATKSFMCILWNLTLNLASLKFNQRRGSKELGLSTTRNMVFRWGSCKTIAKAVHFRVICGSAI